MRRTGISGRVGEGDSPKVREGDEPIAQPEVLHNPLSIDLLQRNVLLPEGVCDGSALGHVLDDRRAGVRRGDYACDCDRVTGGDGDACSCVRMLA